MVDEVSHSVIDILSLAAFVLQQQHRAVAAETAEPSKPKTLTTCSFTEKAADTWHRRSEQWLSSWNSCVWTLNLLLCGYVTLGDLIALSFFSIKWG